MGVAVVLQWRQVRVTGTVFIESCLEPVANWGPIRVASQVEELS